MITQEELNVLFMCIEGFLHGMISVLCAFTCTLAKEVQSFSGLGIYSGIFAIYYLQCQVSKLSKDSESRTTTAVFYALCLLYILSTVTIASDLLIYIIAVSNNYICMNIIFLSVTMQMRIELNHDITNTLPAQLQLDIDLQSMLFRASILQGIAYGCCDFIAQCTLVHKFLYLLSSVLFT